MQIKQVWDPATCPSGILPWLAWALSVDDWNADWTEAQKRSAIAASVQVHRTKGTLGALRRALQSVGYEVIVNEDTGVAYTFSLAVNVGEQGVEDDALFNEVERAALRSKNARSHLLGVNAYGEVAGVTRLLVGGISGESTRVWPDVVELLESTGMCRLLTAEQSIDTVTVYPRGPITEIEMETEIEGGGGLTYELPITL